MSTPQKQDLSEFMDLQNQLKSSATLFNPHFIIK